MADTSNIEWCDSTFNPWIGCTKIAPACDHCYAESWAKRFGDVQWGNHPRRLTSAAYWHEPLKWQKKAGEFYAQHHRRRRVFCASLADVFDNQVPVLWREALWTVIEETPDLDWLLLTKRPQNIRPMLPAFWDQIKHHIWLGTTVEEQEHADRNIPHLLDHDAAVRFVSIEPMLGPINLNSILGGTLWMGGQRGCSGTHHGIGTVDCPRERHHHHDERCKPGLDWVIVGGESGPYARPMNPTWLRSIQYQCEQTGTPFLFKQWGEWVSVSEVEGDGPHHRFEDGATVRRIGKKKAGRTLDRMTYDGFPEVRG